MLVSHEFRVAALRRGVLLSSGVAPSARPEVRFAAMVELVNYGFLTRDEDLQNLLLEDLTETIAAAKVVIGSDRNMVPIYPGFPQQVKELPSMTLLIEQLMHYWSYGMLIPDYPTVVRDDFDLRDSIVSSRKVRVVPVREIASELVTSIVTAPVAMSPADFTLMKEALALENVTTERISSLVKASANGENILKFVQAIDSIVKGADFGLPRAEIFDAVEGDLKNSDQLLRVVLALFSKPREEEMRPVYDVVISNLTSRRVKVFTMMNIPRPVRRSIVSALARTSEGFAADRLVNRRVFWQRVLRAVHPYDLKLTDAEKRAVDIVHSNVDYKTIDALAEAALLSGDLSAVSQLLADNAPGKLARRLVSFGRSTPNASDLRLVVGALVGAADKISLATLISAYNGVLVGNVRDIRVLKIPGRKNHMLDRSGITELPEEYIEILLEGLKKSITRRLASLPAPEGVVGVSSSVPVPLVRREAATGDRELLPGEKLKLDGEGKILRIYGHWRNNQDHSGYMDMAVALLDSEFNYLGASSWNNWGGSREWATYSGDKHVHVGDEASEYIDVDLEKVKKVYPSVKYAVSAVYSWSGWPIDQVDFISGAMLRSSGMSGEVFDPRSVVTAFKPTTTALQAIPFAVDLDSNEMVWIDSSSGASQSCLTVEQDEMLKYVVASEGFRPRLALGELAELWAEAHGGEVSDEPVDQEAVLKLV